MDENTKRWNKVNEKKNMGITTTKKNKEEKKWSQNSWVIHWQKKPKSKKHLHKRIVQPTRWQKESLKERVIIIPHGDQRSKPAPKKIIEKGNPWTTSKGSSTKEKRKEATKIIRTTANTRSSKTKKIGEPKKRTGITGNKKIVPGNVLKWDRKMKTKKKSS